MNTSNDEGTAFPACELNGKGQPEMTGFGRPVTAERAREALEDMDDYARMDAGVDAKGPRETLERFIAEHELVVAELRAENARLRGEALLRQALDALERMVRTTGDTLEIPGVTHPSLTAARAAITALRDRLGEAA